MNSSWYSGGSPTAGALVAQETDLAPASEAHAAPVFHEREAGRLCAAAS